METHNKVPPWEVKGPDHGGGRVVPIPQGPSTGCGFSELRDAAYYEEYTSNCRGHFLDKIQRT